MKNQPAPDRKKVLDSILEKPSVRSRKLRAIDEVKEGLESLKRKQKLDFEIFLGGSLAKGTDIRGSDADIFMLFPGDFDALEVLRRLRNEFPAGREEYSDHPYLTLPQKDFSIDIVPGYKAASGGELRTAVDRTPFHVRFVQEEFTDEMKDEVRILKQFLKGIGSYGAESSVQGFSGYAAELLVYRFKNFEGVISKARDWKIPCALDEGPKEFKGASLVMIDPVDSERNVSANVSQENLATFILASRLFSWDRWREFMFPKSREHSLPEDAVVVYFPCRKCNDQVLIPNLRRISTVLKAELEILGFRVVYSSVFVEDGGYIVILPESGTLGETSLHVGPPVTSPNVSSFLEKWKDGTKFGGPFIVGDRICVLRGREERDFSGSVAKILPKIKLSRDFDPNRVLVISGRDLERVPESIRNGFVNPSLGEWIKCQGMLSEIIQNPK